MRSKFAEEALGWGLASKRKVEAAVVVFVLPLAELLGFRIVTWNRNANDPFACSSLFPDSEGRRRSYGIRWLRAPAIMNATWGPRSQKAKSSISKRSSFSGQVPGTAA